jgi:hypothetical protein
MQNLAAMIGEFGSSRNFWDGLDEKAIQRLKSMLSNLNLALDTWLATILNHVTREQTLNIVAVNMNESPHQAQQNFHSIIDNIRVFSSQDTPCVVVCNCQSGYDVEPHLPIGTPFTCTTFQRPLRK